MATIIVVLKYGLKMLCLINKIYCFSEIYILGNNFYIKNNYPIDYPNEIPYNIVVSV